MAKRISTLSLMLAAELGFAGIAWGQAESSQVEITVLSEATGKPVPSRIHIRDAAGKPQRASGLPFWHDHFVCRGHARLELAPGKYTYEVERGPEHEPRTGSFTLTCGAEKKLTVQLRRLIDLPAEGWWPGDLHVHRPVEDAELLMQAEDLHVAPIITWWNNQNLWAKTRLPEEPLKRFDGNRYYHILAGEDEREGGALLFFNLGRPLAITGASREYPSPLKFVDEARRQKGVWIDIEKPFWWDVPVWVANGKVDSIGLANNHMCRDRMYENEAWGKPRIVERLPAPLGNGFWSQEIYYHVLNCGLRIPPSAGSASGVLPNPVGYDRVYVHVGKDLSYEKWWEGLRTGRAFVTNGPLLRVLAAGQLPGHVFTAADGKEVGIEIKAALTTRDPIRFLEIIKNGAVERRVPFQEWSKTGTLGTLTFKESGWFLVRVIADNPKTFRFARNRCWFTNGFRAMPRQLSLEIAQAVPEQTLVQVHLGDDHGSPLLSLGQRLAVVAVNGRQHPVAGDVLVSAADDIDMVFAGAGAGQVGVAAPHGPGDHLGPAVAQLPRHFGEEAVVANHHAEFAEAGPKYRVVVARCNSARDFAARKAKLAVFSRHFAVRVEQDRHVVDEVPVAFEETGHDVKVVLLGQLTEIVRRGPGNRLGTFHVRFTCAEIGQRLAEDDQVRLLSGGFRDEGRELLAVSFWRLAAGPKVDCSQAHLATGWGLALPERNVAPLDFAPGSPEQVEFDNGPGRLGRRSVGVGNLGPALGVRFLVGRVFRLGGSRPTFEITPDGGLAHGYGLPPVVLPDDPHHGAAAWNFHVCHFVLRIEVVVATADDGEGLLPPPMKSLALVGSDDQASVALRPPFGIERKTRPDLVTG
jgi:hypothetical protein